MGVKIKNKTIFDRIQMLKIRTNFRRRVLGMYYAASLANRAVEVNIPLMHNNPKQFEMELMYATPLVLKTI